jgi:hypothetical protein
MTAETERARLERARELDDTDDLEEEVTDALGSARAARLDPDALRSLAQCALVLGADSLTVYRATGDPFPTDSDMAEAVDDAEAAIADRAAVVTDELDGAESELADARDAIADARDELADAKAMPTHRPCDGCHDERRDAIAEAREAIADARERIDTAKAAIAVLTDVGKRLARALKLIRRVLPEVGEVYETVYGHVDAGRLLPKDGDWITGADTAVVAVSRPGRPAALADAQRLLGAALIGERAGARTHQTAAPSPTLSGRPAAAPEPPCRGAEASCGRPSASPHGRSGRDPEPIRR